MNSKSIQNQQLASNKDISKKSYSTNTPLVKKSILAIDITSDKKTNILEFIVKSVENSDENYYITTPNPEMVVYANSHSDFATILNASQLALADGVGLLWAGKVLGKPLTERFTGVDAVEKLCEMVANRPISVGFFGGMPGVAERTAECLVQKYSTLKVVYASDTWDESKIGKFSQEEGVRGRTKRGDKQEDNVRVIGRGNSLVSSFNRIDILFVALGFPKQEEWMASHLNKIPVKVMIGVGGAFDYIAGIVSRPPKWVQNIGMEWLYRLVRQPWRVKRQLALPVFVWLVLKEKLFSKH